MNSEVEHAELRVTLLQKDLERARANRSPLAARIKIDLQRAERYLALMKFK